MTRKCFPHHWSFVKETRWFSSQRISHRMRKFDRMTSWQEKSSPHKGPVIWSLDVFFVLSRNKPLNKQSSFRWFTTPWRSCDTALFSESPFHSYLECVSSWPASQVRPYLNSESGDFVLLSYRDKVNSDRTVFYIGVSIGMLFGVVCFVLFWMGYWST